ncbi:uncharacterized mitochondrial protein AtMg00310-like [Coffea arabica]|uniref:Uncharacterized mitochondrial protein AtMg00310-like n=1 Tax=Coffea arabica TaxID=13443 RepID=A0A6P6VIM9_COFAR
MTIGRTKNQVFGYLKSIITSKLQGWKHKLFSPGGKEVLIKSVIMSMPTYVMSYFKLPKGLCKGISATIARFWWDGGKLGNKVHWVRWNKLSEVKGKGGLGFRDLEAFNVALLAKQIWRVITNPNLLVSKVLKDKYMKSDDWLIKKPLKTASWCWKSMNKGGELLQQGLYKRVGDGRTIKIWNDRWLPGSIHGKIATTRPDGCQLEFVHELIEGRKWKTDQLQLWFNANDMELITSVPLSPYDRKDRLYWDHSKSGVYTVKTGYVVAKGGRDTMIRRSEPDSETS